MFRIHHVINKFVAPAAISLALLGACDASETAAVRRDDDVPELATLKWSQDGSQPFYVWQVVDGNAMVVDDVEVIAAVVDDAAADGVRRPGGDIADVSEAAEQEDNGDRIVIRYAGEGVAPEMSFDFVPMEEVSPRATATAKISGLRFDFEGFGFRSIKSKPVGGSVASTFYNKSTVNAGYTTLFGPTTYSSCTYAYNCASPYGMGVRTTWASGSRTVNYTMTSSCSPSC